MRLHFPIYILACAIFFVRCESVVLAVLYPSDCVSCEVRMSETFWDSLPVWQQQGCGGKIPKIRRQCQEVASEKNGYCRCFGYSR